MKSSRREKVPKLIAKHHSNWVKESGLDVYQGYFDKYLDIDPANETDIIV